MDCFVVPLQEKLEDWKKIVVNLDKDHAKGEEMQRTRSVICQVSLDERLEPAKVGKFITLRGQEKEH